MKRIFTVIGTLLGTMILFAQDIPKNTSYTQIYDFIDELAIDRVIGINSVVKPYSRDYIAQKLREAQAADSLLTKRQRKDLAFFLNDYALECDTVPKNIVSWTDKKTFALSLLQPSFHYYNKNFKARITPILGMDLIGNRKGLIMKRWWGAELQMDIVNHVSVWGSYRDQSYNGHWLRDDYFPTIYDKISGAKIAQPTYLNQIPGCEYKEANYGGDYSDLRGGIKAYAWWGSVGLVKDVITWGDNYNGSNIISGHAPSFPMITLNLKPCKWFELNYIHGWLVSNVLDSTHYYVEENYTDSTSKIHYRPANKFIAANMITFTPIRGLNISMGNSIIYSENNVQAGYFIPIAFYKSIDHLLTKGLKVENQNSQVFFNISSRNVKHLHLYGSLYIDEVSWKRLKKNNPQQNPISYKLGFNVSNWPLKNLSLQGEFTRTNIINYKHSIQRLTWASNSYNLGHYLGDNSQDIYVALNYKPVRGLNLNLSYTNATKFNDYEYIRRDVINAISQKPFNEKTWQNDIVELDAIYEVVNNAYARINVRWNNARGFDLALKPLETPVPSENRLTAQQYLDKFSSKFEQGSNWTFTFGFSFGF
ncbi:MAG: hypothetical protein KBB61_01035 [Paludibacteraceae bacterium]|jgi:hypothetical protein|nr:hypothetical protein [Paludibacteraceae bacterium]MBP9039954.1 hypothetical protein [Paludibacteraceae bacterium]HHT61313.1 capsule assembly Wzi family protein [Bacteroidales bacterium]